MPLNRWKYLIIRSNRLFSNDKENVFKKAQHTVQLPLRTYICFRGRISPHLCREGLVYRKSSVIIPLSSNPCRVKTFSYWYYTWVLQWQDIGMINSNQETFTLRVSVCLAYAVYIYTLHVHLLFFYYFNFPTVKHCKIWIFNIFFIKYF